MIKALIPLLVGFITSNSDLSTEREFPTVTFMDQCSMGIEVTGDCYGSVYAAYDSLNNRILLPLDGDLSDPLFVSALIHELTHWMQDLEPKNFLDECSIAEVEIQAYEIQQKYLDAFGVNYTKAQIMDYIAWCESSKIPS